MSSQETKVTETLTIRPICVRSCSFFRHNILCTTRVCIKIQNSLRPESFDARHKWINKTTENETMKISSILRRSRLLTRGWFHLVVQHVSLMRTHLKRHEIRRTAVLLRWSLLLRLLLLVLQLLLRLHHRAYVPLRCGRHRWNWTHRQWMRKQFRRH